MSYLHSMTTYTQGIKAIAPAKWRALDGLVGVHWDAEGQCGGEGYYLSPDPRIMFFFNDVSAHIRVTNREDGLGRSDRPLARALYVPAGMPMWTRFSGFHRFSHLDLHLHQDRLLRYLAPSLGSSKARSILKRPVELQDVGPIPDLARMLVDEVASPSRHPVFAESLVGSIATALLDIPQEESAPNGRLTQAQMNRLLCEVPASGDHRMTVAEMADIVGLSESWFATVFRQTTGKTPLQWQLSRRVDAACDLLLTTQLSIADVAAQLGFADQAHLTKVFRQAKGETPAAWRRANMAGRA